MRRPPVRIRRKAQMIQTSEAASMALFEVKGNNLLLCARVCSDCEPEWKKLKAMAQWQS